MWIFVLLDFSNYKIALSLQVNLDRRSHGIYNRRIFRRPPRFERRKGRAARPMS